MSQLDAPKANRKCDPEKSAHFHSRSPGSEHPGQATLGAPGLPMGAPLCAGCCGMGRGLDVWHQQG